MFGNGLEKPVLINVLPRTYETDGGPFGDSVTRTVEFDRLIVWADRGYTDVFKNVPGVMSVTPDKSVGVRYIIYVDPRYNLKWVMAEIEAAAKIAVPVQEPSNSEMLDERSDAIYSAFERFFGASSSDDSLSLPRPGDS